MHLFGIFIEKLSFSKRFVLLESIKSFISFSKITFKVFEELGEKKSRIKEGNFIQDSVNRSWIDSLKCPQTSVKCHFQYSDGKHQWYFFNAHHVF